MPQFDPTTFSPQIIWLLITFALLYIAMSKMALPRISRVLEERQHKIDENLKKAAAMQKEALAAAKAYENTLSEARGKAQDILRIAREKMSDQAAKRQDELGERLNQKIQDAEERIEKARKKALSQVREVALKAVASTTTKLVGEEFDSNAIDDAIDIAMKEAS